MPTQSQKPMKLQLHEVCAIFAIFLVIQGCSSAQKNPWHDATSPAAGPAEAIGGYAAGCLRGAESLYADGPGYHVMRLSRRRFYGHPDLIRYVTRLGAAVDKQKLGALLVGDLAQPRGGPALSGHASHQSGLDVDIWYSPASSEQVTLDGRENFSARLWNDGLADRAAAILRLAAGDAQVERIFVNPSLKRELCTRWGARQKLAPVLRRIRPWWGHEDHFHVRLKCPEGSMSCKVQEQAPEGAGCDPTLDWWFSAEAIAEAAKKKSEMPSTKLPELPEACRSVLESP